MREITVLHYAEVATPNWLLFEAAARRRNIRLVAWEPHRLQVYCSGKRCRPYYDGRATVPDIALHRTVALFEGIVVPALRLLSELGTTVLNDPPAAYLARDKLATTIRLCDNAVPVVATLGVDPSNDAPMFGIDDGRVIVKPAHSVRGEGVRAFSSAAEVKLGRGPHRRMSGAYCVREHYIIQPLIESGGRDLRAYVVNGECVAIMQRQAKKGEIRANLALGATPTKLPDTHPAATVAVAAAAACGLDYGGVDLIEDTDGVIRVLEVDAWAGFAGIASVTGVDVAGAILDLAVTRHDNSVRREGGIGL